MRIMKFVIYTIILIISIINLNIFADEKDDIKILIDASSICDLLINTGIGRLKYEFINVDSTSIYDLNRRKELQKFVKKGKEKIFVNHYNYRKVDLEYAFDKVKIFCNQKYVQIDNIQEINFYKKYNKNITQIFDGEKTYYLSLSGIGKNDLIIPQGHIVENNRINVKRYDPRYYGLSIMNTKISDFLKGYYNNKKLNEIKYEG